MLVIVADAIDEERRCPVDAALKSGLEILKDTSRVAVVLKLSLESRHVKLQSRGVTTQGVLGRRTTAFVDSPVHIPKPTLRAGSLHCLSRDQGHRMSVEDWEVTHDEHEFIAQAFPNAAEYQERRLT